MKINEVSSVGRKIKPKKFEEVKPSPRYCVNDGENYSPLLEALEEDFCDDSNKIEVDGYTFSFDLQDLPHCCGVIELGEIRLDKQFPEKDVLTVLEYLVSEFTKGDKCQTIIINTNNDSWCVRLATILAKSKYFALVKTFVNSNSSSTIKMWVSKN